MGADSDSKSRISGAPFRTAHHHNTMSEDAPKALHATHKPDPKPEAAVATQSTDAAAPVELTAMVYLSECAD